MKPKKELKRCAERGRAEINSLNEFWLESDAICCWNKAQHAPVFSILFVPALLSYSFLFPSLIFLCLAAYFPAYFRLPSVTQFLLCSQNRNRTTEAAINLVILCFLLCVRFQCVTGSGQRWRETSWWRSTIPSSSNCTTVSQPIAELCEEESPANRSSSLSTAVELFKY